MLCITSAFIPKLLDPCTKLTDVKYRGYHACNSLYLKAYKGLSTENGLLYNNN